MLEHAYNGAFDMPRMGFNVANEFVRFGVLVGLRQLGEGVELYIRMWLQIQ